MPTAAASGRASGTTPPRPRISTVVEHTTYLDQVRTENVVDGKREAAQRGTTKIPVPDSPVRWHGGDQVEHPVELPFELGAEAGPLRLIPRKSLRDVRGGFGSEHYPIGHDRLRSRSLARTSSQLNPGPGSGWSSRRSNSSLCQSGTGTSSGLRLSQISSRSSRRSSGGSRRISSRSALGVMGEMCREGRAARKEGECAGMRHWAPSARNGQGKSELSEGGLPERLVGRLRGARPLVQDQAKAKGKAKQSSRDDKGQTHAVYGKAG